MRMMRFSYCANSFAGHGWGGVSEELVDLPPRARHRALVPRGPRALGSIIGPANRLLKIVPILPIVVAGC